MTTDRDIARENIRNRWRQNVVMLLRGGDFDESEHPRDPDGKFSGGGGGGDESSGGSGSGSTIPESKLGDFEPKWSNISDPKQRVSAQLAVIAWLGQYDEINKALRSGSSGDWASGSQQHLIRGLDRAFNYTAHTLSSDTIVYRGVTSEFAKPEVGSTFVDRGFAAVSPTQSGAAQFSNDPKGGGTLMKITLPKGTKILAPMVTKLEPGTKAKLIADGIPAEDHAAIAEGAEAELLLSRGTTFTVTGESDGVVHVRVGKK